MNTNSLVLHNLLLKSEYLKNADNRHTQIRPAIYFEGGGMRGIFGIGVAMGLEQAGLTNTFDAIVGGSAGACNAMYFAAGQSELASTVYLDDLTGVRFISWKRFSKIMDIDYLADEVFRHTKRLDVAKLKSSRARLLVTMTCAQTGTGIIVDVLECGDPIVALKASMAIPIFYGRCVDVNGRQFFDGEVSLPLAIEQVIETVLPTDLLVVLNRPLRRKSDRISFLASLVIKIVFANKAHLRQAMLRYPEISDKNIRIIETAVRRTIKNVNIDVICPKICPITILTRNRISLEKYLVHGIKMTQRFLRRP